jgi:hypothetical protein
MHAAHRAADDQTQMSDTETFGDQPIAGLDHVMVAVVREFALQPVGGLAGSAAADRVRHDDKVLRGIERLAGRKQLVGEARAQPIGPSAGVTL